VDPKPSGPAERAGRLTDAAHYGVTLRLAAGSKAHIACLPEIAAERNVTLEERHLFRGDKIVAAASEEEIYEALGMQRHQNLAKAGRIAGARSCKLPRLVTDSHIKGILQAHTDRSDGVDTLETMAKAMLARGSEYFGVAHHSKSAHYAGGLGAEEVAEQQAER
jgi:DNA polymerase (family X)